MPEPIGYTKIQHGRLVHIAPSAYAQLEPWAQKGYAPFWHAVYYWLPEGHGPWSYFVLATSAEEAAVQINAWRHQQKSDSYSLGEKDIKPEELTMAVPGEVLIADNN